MKLIPKYTQIKIQMNNEAARKTLTQTKTIRIKNEIKECDVCLNDLLNYLG
jgi:hypothetical protein